MVLKQGLNAAAKLKVEQRAPHQASNDQSDIIALVRHFMADEQLSQDPLLVIPKELHGRVREYIRDVNSVGVILDRRNRSADRSAELRKLADFLRVTYGHIYDRGIAYLLSLAAGSQPPQAPQLQMLQRGEHCDVSRLLSFDRSADVAFIPHKLQVQFPRNIGRVLR